MPRRTIDERFRNRLRKDEISGCLVWLGATANKAGHGHFWINGRLVYTHRYAWERVHGPVPEGKKVLHHCDNPPCCEIEHLFLGTQADNIADMIKKGRHVSCPGTANGNAVLTEDAVRLIRELYDRGEANQLELAALFEVSNKLISQVVNYKAWKHVL